MREAQVIHFQFLNELKALAGEVVGTEFVERLSKEVFSTVKVLNEKPYRKPDMVLVDVYLMYCYSHPVPVYMKKSDLERYQEVGVSK